MLVGLAALPSTMAIYLDEDERKDDGEGDGEADAGSDGDCFALRG